MQERSFSPSLSLKVVFLSLSVMAFPSQAFAGFQWVSPQETGSQVETAPSAAAEPAMTPIVVEGAEVVIDPKAESMKKQELPSVLTISPTASLAATPLAKAPAPAAEIPAPASKEEKPVRGFANNVPLAVALRQILPTEYGFSVDQDVNMGMLVSWRGGKAWQATVQDMLQGVGLSMREQGQMVSIGRNAERAPAPASAPAKTLSAEPSAPLSLTPSRYETNPSKVLTAPAGQMKEMPAPSKAAPAYEPAPVSQPVSMIEPINIASAPDLPSLSMDTPDVWVAERGQTLRGAIEKWSAKLGIEVSWQAEYDYPVQVPFAFTGTYQDALRTILKGFEEAQPRPLASLHGNTTAGQPVLVVTAQGNNYGE